MMFKKKKEKEKEKNENLIRTIVKSELTKFQNLTIEDSSSGKKIFLESSNNSMEELFSFAKKINNHFFKNRKKKIPNYLK
jgi:phosphoheptose isomerase